MVNLKALGLTILSTLTIGATPALANRWIQTSGAQNIIHNGLPMTVKVSYGTEWDKTSYSVHYEGRYYQFNVWAKCSGGRYTEWTTDGADASELTHTEAADLAAELCGMSGTTGRF